MITRSDQIYNYKKMSLQMYQYLLKNNFCAHKGAKLSKRCQFGIPRYTCVEKEFSNNQIGILFLDTYMDLDNHN